MDTIGGVEVLTDLGTSKILRFLDIPPATRSLEAVLAPPGLRKHASTASGFGQCKGPSWSRS
jgi:hypothetical protein